MLTRLKLLLFFIIFASIVFSFNNQAEPATITVRSGHPRLFITPENLSTLKQRAATTHKDTYAVLKNWCDTYWNNSTTQQNNFFMIEAGHEGSVEWDSSALRYALIYILGQISGYSYEHSINDYGDKAVSIVLTYIGTHTYSTLGLKYVSLVYDWCNSRISSGNKTTIVNWLHSNVAMFDGGETPTGGEYTGYFYLSTPPSMYPGLAFYGDGVNDSLATTYVNYISTYLNNAKALGHEGGKDGGIGGGQCYGRLYYSGGYFGPNCGSPTWEFQLINTATDIPINNTFGAVRYPMQYPIWMLYGVVPGSANPSKTPVPNGIPMIAYEDCGDWVWNVQYQDLALATTFRIAAGAFKSLGETTNASLVTWFVNTKFNLPSINSTWDIVFNDKTITSSDPDSLGVSPQKAFGWNETNGVIDSYLTAPKAGVGQVFMRGSWSFNAGTTYSVFRAPPYFYHGHQHYDSLSFSIFKGEHLILPNSGRYFFYYEGDDFPDPYGASGWSHYYSYYTRGVATNSILIMDPTNVIQAKIGGYINTYKDGGQRVDYSIHYWGDSLTTADWGGLKKYENLTDYTYISADATKGYLSLITNLVQRDYVFLKSNDGNNDYFVVFDRVNSSSSTAKKVVVLHTIGEPILNGSTTQIFGVNGNGGLWSSTNSNSITVTQSTAKLFLKNLLPSSTVIYKMGGYQTTTLTSSVDNSDGGTYPDTVDLNVTSSSGFPDKPFVVIDHEGFACTGKTTGKLTGCVRGAQLWRASHNAPISHNNGATVRQDYSFMIRETNTGYWAPHPQYYGNVDGVYAYEQVNAMLGDHDIFGRWALRIENSANENNTNFLNVLHPTVNMAETSMAETVLIDAGNMAGALIKDSSMKKIVIFSKTKDLQNNLTYNASYSGSGKHLITGLEYGTYDIYRNGIKIYTQQTSSQNTLYFESSGGDFQVVKYGVEPVIPPSHPTGLKIW